MIVIRNELRTGIALRSGASEEKSENSDNKPVELSKNDCEDDDAYENLCKGVDGGLVPGRKKKPL